MGHLELNPKKDKLYKNFDPFTLLDTMTYMCSKISKTLNDKKKRFNEEYHIEDMHLINSNLKKKNEKLHFKKSVLSNNLKKLKKILNKSQNDFYTQKKLTSHLSQEISLKQKINEDWVNQQKRDNLFLITRSKELESGKFVYLSRITKK